MDIHQMDVEQHMTWHPLCTPLLDVYTSGDYLPHFGINFKPDPDGL